MKYESTISSITTLLFLETTPALVDLIFVFGNDWIDTINDVHLLWLRNIAPKILITGNTQKQDNHLPESQRFREQAITLGIPTEAILVEDKATNTKENIQLSLPILEKNIGMDKINSILFVCKAFHTRRVLMTAQKYFPTTTEFSFYPTYDERNIRKDNWWKTRESFERVMHELRRISEYSLKGDISIE